MSPAEVVAGIIHQEIASKGHVSPAGIDRILTAARFPREPTPQERVKRIVEQVAWDDRNPAEATDAILAILHPSVQGEVGREG